MQYFYKKNSRFFIGLSVIFLLTACKKNATFHDNFDTLFTALPAERTGIDFQNTLSYTEDFNPYTYRNFYNGGGVGLGDINNDGLIDVYFCGNQVDNKLYLNKGNFQFEDITEQAGVACPGIWSTGVAMADVNGDGWLDIYVCKSGKPEGERRYNELFINNGDLTFTEKAAEYGLNDLGLSSHAAFFDYDKDGDLDCYLLNNSIRSVGGYDLIKDQRNIPDPQGGNKLYRNDGEPTPGRQGGFVNISQEAGIYSSAIGFGLGVTIGDVNRDGWQDIYVSNDFFEKDYLYINQKNGTFKESLEAYIRELSLSSMGADMADLNNDGYPEIFVTDMLPEDDARMKTKTTFENWNKYQLNIQQGYYKQFTRNVLQLNLGKSDIANDTPGAISNVAFSEVGRLAGVNATDWSWGALLFDLNNDGYKDIFVANGIYKDLTDQDYINFYSDPNTIRAILSKEKAVIQRMIDTIPSAKIANYAFVNQGVPKDLTQVTAAQFSFVNQAKELGLGEPGFSNGSAYGDLDNDGDLDLVVNNTQMPAFIYRNNTDTLLNKNHYLVIELKGEDKNTFGLGAQVSIRHKGDNFYQELAPMRGFQSCVDSRLHFGLGDVQVVDTVMVQWNDGRVSLLTQVATNQFLKIEQKEAIETTIAPPIMASALFKPIKAPDFQHIENDFSDFDRDRLIYQMLSSEGPKIAKGDVNGDGREDFYICGAKDQAGRLFMQTGNGQFRLSNEALFEQDKLSEDTDALFFDADGDKDLDLYVTSGGNEFPNTSTALADRLYFNNGKGNFTKSPQLLPSFNFESTACVQAFDYDKDGDNDLFVGVRVRPFLYGVPCNGYILQNNGKGEFTDITSTIAPELINIGMITDAVTGDYDKDGDTDLIITGEFMPIMIFQNNNGTFKNVTENAGLSKTNGFWHNIQVADIEQDGDIDFVVGNQGLNTRIKATQDKPATMYINDFDQNGTAEQILCTYNGDQSYPLVLRHDLVAQLPGLKKKYLKYVNYKNQTITDIFSPEQLKKAVTLHAYESQSSLVVNNGDGTFTLKSLPGLAQLSCVYAVLLHDFDQDGAPDILLGGNFYRAKPEVGISDGSYGLFLKGDGKGNFTPQLPQQSGFFVKGEIRDLVNVKIGAKNAVLVAKNNDYLQLFQY